MARDPIQTWCYSIIIVRQGARVLMVQERKHGERWYFPAGGVEPGETFEQAALRETAEEAGIAVALDGILRVEHTPGPDGTARLRVFFVAHPVDATPPKTVADEHSLQAAWMDVEHLEHLPLRGQEVRVLIQHLDGGGAVYPLPLLCAEGTPFSR